MYLQKIDDSILPSHMVQIQYDCAGGNKRCGKKVEIKFKYAKKNYEDNDGKHICRSCQLKANNPTSRKEVIRKRELKRERSSSRIKTFADLHDMDFELVCCSEIKSLGIEFDHLRFAI